jgi:hypothetical protein
VVTLKLGVVDSLEWVHKKVLVKFDMFVLFVRTNTKEALVHVVVQRCNVLIFNRERKMALEELRKKVLYQNSIEIWIGASKEKNIDWFETENYQKFIAFLLKNNLNMKQMPICFDESDKASDGGHSKKVFANKLAAFNDENSSCYSIKLNDGNIELIRKFDL